MGVRAQADGARVDQLAFFLRHLCRPAHQPRLGIHGCIQAAPLRTRAADWDMGVVEEGGAAQHPPVQRQRQRGGVSSVGCHPALLRPHAGLPLALARAGVARRDAYALRPQAAARWPQALQPLAE